MKWALFLLVVLFLFFQYKLWVGDGSMVDVNELRREIATLQEENKRLQARNLELDAEVEDLKEGLDAIEERARANLGMIKKGEIFYHVISDDKQDGGE